MMLASLSSRLPRRPKFFVAALFALLFLFAFSRYGADQSAVSLNPFGASFLAKSPFYSSYEKPADRYYAWKTPSFFPPLKNAEPKSSAKPDYCANFPTHLLDRIQVVLKTGTGEPAKNKAHIATVTSCFPNLLVFSDLEDRVGNHHFIDVLADLPPSYNVDNPDFATYAAQKEAHAKGGDVGYSKEGWKLDRFKFLPMVEKAYEMRPKADWYVFIETDVYYFWDTLFRLLSQLDPNKMHYMGSPAPGAGLFFAYGGAGFVLSRGLVQRFVDQSDGGPRPSVRFEDMVKKDCCGDAILGYALFNRTGVKLQALYPTFAGDELKGIRVDREWWCVPILALHRVSPEQMNSVWEWERTRPYNEKPIVLSSLLDHTLSFLRDGPSTKELWDNYSGDVQPDRAPAHASAAACRDACIADVSCLQYTYNDSTCRFGKYIQMGRPVTDKGEFISGWDVGKMAKLGFGSAQQLIASCPEATWLKPEVR